MEFQNVRIPVARPHFDVAVVRPVPLIERFGDVYPAAIEVKRLQLWPAMVVGMKLSADAHGLPPKEAACPRPRHAIGYATKSP